MPQVKYVGPFDEVEVPVLGAVVKRGESVEADAETAKSLLRQSDAWESGKKSTTSKES